MARELNSLCESSGWSSYDQSLQGHPEETETQHPYGVHFGSGREDDEWITVMPIYTMAELEKADREIIADNIAQVEHMELGGMEADAITLKEAEKSGQDAAPIYEAAL